MIQLRFLILLAFLTSLLGCVNNNNETKADANNEPVTKPVENITATEDQRDRRNTSETLCKSKGIPVYSNQNSLFVESEESVKIRTKDEVVDRAIAILYLGLKSEGLEEIYLNKVDSVFGVASKLTPDEKAYAFADNPTKQQQTNANWRYESLHVLLWSLSYIDELVYPSQMCNVADDVTIIYELGPDKFRDQAKLRSKKEILDQADLILRYHWACVSARVKGENAPGGLNSSVVYERHYSLNWLINYLNQDWDNVTTDT